VAGMVRNRHLSLSISDASWATFLSMLEYKLETLSRILIKVNPAYTSQICSQCGAIVKKSLSQRTHYCPECLYVDDRDVNAAKNILKIGTVRPFVETASIEGSMKQEASWSLAKRQFTLFNYLNLFVKLQNYGGNTSYILFALIFN